MRRGAKCSQLCVLQSRLDTVLDSAFSLLYKLKRRRKGVVVEAVSSLMYTIYILYQVCIRYPMRSPAPSSAALMLYSLWLVAGQLHTIHHPRTRVVVQSNTEHQWWFVPLCTTKMDGKTLPSAAQDPKENNSDIPVAPRVCLGSRMQVDSRNVLNESGQAFTGLSAKSNAQYCLANSRTCGVGHYLQG